MLTRREQLLARAADCGLTVRTYAPGDGVTRIRFFIGAHNSYFGPDNGIYTALGIKEAEAFIDGFSAGCANPHLTPAEPVHA